MRRAAVILCLLAGLARGQDAGPLAAVLAGGSQRWSPASLSPVGWYKGDNSAANSGSALPATATWGGSASYATGQNGNAFNFDGSNWIDSGTNCLGGACLYAAAGRAWTVACWMWRPTGSTGYVIARGGGTTANMTFALAGSGINLRGTSTSLTIPYDTWSHVVITWDGTNGKAYINAGSPVALTIGTASEEADQRIVAGGRNNGTANRWTGKVDDWLIWNRALSATEVDLLYAWRQ